VPGLYLFFAVSHVVDADGLAGLRFKVGEQLSIDVELGWSFPAFFAGAGVGYFF
jgi:hypothetical protein